MQRFLVAYARICAWILFSGVWAARVEEAVNEELQVGLDVELQAVYTATLGTGSSALGAQMMALMATADHFLAHESMEKEHAGARSMPMAQDLEELGWSVARRFRHFAFSLTLQQQPEGGQDAPGTAALLETQLEEAGHPKTPTALIQEPQPRSAGFRGAARRVIQFGRALKDPCSETSIDGELAEMDFAVESDSPRHVEARHALSNFCKLSRYVQKTDGEKLEVQGLQSLRIVDNELQVQSPTSGSGPDSRTSGVDKRRWYAAQAAAQEHWLHVFGIGQSSDESKQFREVRQIFLKISVMNMKLTNILKAVQKAHEVPWMTVTEDTVAKRTGKLFTQAIEGVEEYIGIAGSNMLEFFKGVWDSFKRILRQQEQRCSDSSKKLSLKVAQDNFKDLPMTSSAEDLHDPEGQHAQKDVDDFTNKLQGMDQHELEAESKRVDGALSSLEQEAGKEAGSKDDIKREVESIVTRSNELETTMKSESGSTEQYLSEMDSIDEKVIEVQSSMCNTRTASVAQKLKASLQAAVQAMSNTVKAAALTPIPLLGIRGYFVAGGIAQAGVEEFVDFRNREIGQFRFAALQYGSSATGVGIGGYAGIGWKGYKENWTLEEACQTGLWSAKALSGSVFGVPLGIGVTVVTDADNSGKGPWVPEPHGINAVNFGWSASWSFADFLLAKSDWGATKERMMHSECFDSVNDLVKHIWLPTCRLCEKGAETAVVTALRASVVFGTLLWPLPELAFSTLAYLYEKIREPEYKESCSASSVNQRANPAAFVSHTAKLFFETVQLANEVEKQASVLSSTLAIAQKYNQQFTKSRELEDVTETLGKLMETCRKLPPDFSGARDHWESLQQQSSEQLEDMCAEFKLMKSTEREENLVRLRLFMQLRDGQMTADEVEALAEKAKAVKHDGTLVVDTECRNNEVQDECKTGFEMAKALTASLNSGELQILCISMDVNCNRKCRTFLRWGWDCQPWDDEMKSFLIVNSLGGGEVDAASENNPFGTCKNDEGCVLDNTKCLKQPGHYHRSNSETIKRCSCKPNFCHSSEQGDEGMQDVCKQHSSTWNEILDGITDDILSRQLAIGSMIGRFVEVSRA